MILLLIIVFFGCWIDNESWAVWTFFIPVASICFINLCLLTFNWHTLAKQSKNNGSQANKQKQNKSVVKKHLITLINIFMTVKCPIVLNFRKLRFVLQITLSSGCTWLFGIFGRLSVVMAYGFVIAFPMQGILSAVDIFLLNKVKFQEIK